jgi:hypothetical protein
MGAIRAVAEEDSQLKAIWEREISSELDVALKVCLKLWEDGAEHLSRRDMVKFADNCAAFAKHIRIKFEANPKARLSLTREEEEDPLTEEVVLEGASPAEKASHKFEVKFRDWAVSLQGGRIAEFAGDVSRIAELLQRALSFEVQSVERD